MSSGARTKLDGFDGLRALAALSVVSYHVALSSKFAHAGSLAPLLWELKGGVAIFFVISGVLLYLPYARAIRDRSALPDWRVYARRRGVRILPAYWVALTVGGDRAVRRGRVRPRTPGATTACRRSTTRRQCSAVWASPGACASR